MIGYYRHSSDLSADWNTKNAGRFREDTYTDIVKD
jgi:hypothetical protein